MKILTLTNQGGEKITKFVQWESGRVVFFEGNYTVPPEVHYSSSMLDEGYVVEAQKADDTRYSAIVPNKCLESNTPMTIFIYVKENDDDTSGYVDAMNSYNIVMRKRPADYVYKENTDVIHIKELSAEIELLKDSMQELQNQYGATVEEVLELKETLKADISKIKENFASESQRIQQDFREEADETLQNFKNTKAEFESEITGMKNTIKSYTDQLDKLGLYVDADGDVCQKEDM